jgi:uncharacterized protein
LGKGHFPDDLLTSDMTIWTITSGSADKARLEGGMKVLASIFGGTLEYIMDTLIVEGDRVAAEVKSRGTLISGEPFKNDHVFMFRLREGRIAAVAEYMNQPVVREKIVPLMQSVMAQRRT